MVRFWLLEQGFPYVAVLTEEAAAALYAAAPREQRSGSVAQGSFTTWVVLVNGVGRRIPLTTRARLIPPEELARIAHEVGRFSPLPGELAHSA